MAKPTFSTTARRDIQEIEDYLATWSEPAAERFLRDLGRRAAMHANMPRMGREVGAFAPGVRRFLVGKYTALYRIIDDGIFIQRMFHGSRDIAAAFADDLGENAD